MEKVIIIQGDSNEIAEGLQKLISNSSKANPQTDFKKDRMTTTEAANLAGVSLPTFGKWVKAGLIPRHGSGNKHFYFRSELIESLRKMADEKGNEID